MIRNPRNLLAAAFALASASLALAQDHPLAPQLSTNPGARYTLYLNFSGFNYSGAWGNTGRTPGNVPAYTTDGDATAFSDAENTAIRETWARFAQTYVGFNINVTTVDPLAAGLTDAQRQAGYDARQYTMHTILGGSNAWYGNAGGVSYLGTAQNANVSTGRHTNWVFPAGGSGTSSKNMAAAGIHEDGHGLRLPHQHDETFSAGQNGFEYSSNGSQFVNGQRVNPNSVGNGSYAPIMGTSYVSQRGTWRVGSAAKNNVNDVAELQLNRDIGGLLDDGIGHSFLTATSLAINPDGSVNVASAATKGWIMPKASTGYSAVGEDSYTKDFFSFRSGGGLVTLTANDGTSYLQNGVADPGATMRSVIRVFDKSFNLLGTGTEDATTLRHTFSASLAAGDYYAQIVSVGAYTSTYEPNVRYFNMGGYFLTGNGLAQPVPEPASLAALALGAGAFLRRRRKSA